MKTFYKVVYKVVKRKTRYSCMLNGRTCKLALKYEKGTIVKAPEYTLGIFCFNTFDNAHRFAADENCKILEVEPIGKGKRWRFIYSYYQLITSYQNKKTRTLHVPEGTICFPAVKVLT